VRLVTVRDSVLGERATASGSTKFSPQEKHVGSRAVYGSNLLKVTPLSTRTGRVRASWTESSQQQRDKKPDRRPAIPTAPPTIPSDQWRCHLASRPAQADSLHYFYYFVRGVCNTFSFVWRSVRCAYEQCRVQKMNEVKMEIGCGGTSIVFEMALLQFPFQSISSLCTLLSSESKAILLSSTALLLNLSVGCTS